MARFTAEQAHATVEIQQLIHDWARELDLDNGANIAELVTQDCRYAVGGGQAGRAAVVKFYQERLARLAATAEGVPVHRHALHNLRVQFSPDNGGADTASITFNLTYFSSIGHPKGVEQAEPLLYADVWMDVRREGDGHWRIALFDSAPVFRRV